MLYRLIRPLLFRLAPEHAQAAATHALRFLRWGRRGEVHPLESGAPTKLFGLRFANRIGLAAGFDKSARHLDELGGLGFGCIEVGSVTPRAQPGNPPPNLFRLVQDRALINRMGFNNDGVEAVVQRLEKRRYTGICGVNVGKNADTPLSEAWRDYVTCLRAVYPVADYVTINISSPNTEGLRKLQDTDALRQLLEKMIEARATLSGVHGKYVPLLVKLSPDLSPANLDALGHLLPAFALDGIVATNTTTTRPRSLKSQHAGETGGLSGRPLHDLSVAVIGALRARLGARIAIIGVGGICDVPSARASLAAGADLLQLYTGLIYEGPGLVSQLITAATGTQPRA